MPLKWAGRRVACVHGDRQVRVVIELTNAAPIRDYAVELWDVQDCDFPRVP